MAKKPATAGTTKAPTSGGGPARVAILHGPDAFIRQEETQRLREALTKAHGEIDTVLFDGVSAQASEVLDECRSFGLIATHKLVIVDNVHELVKEATRPLFERYAQNPSETATLVLRSDRFIPGKLGDMVEAVGVVIKCDPPSESDASAWIVKRAASAHQATLDPKLAASLVARVGANLAQLDSEVAKLAAAAGGGNTGPVTITPELVTQFVGVSRDEEAWNIQRSLLSGNASAGLAHLHHIIHVSRKPTQAVMFAVLDLARKLHGLSAGMAAGQSPGAMMKPLKLWGPSADAVIQTARRLRPDQTLAFLEACVEADARAKSGLGEHERALELLVLRLQRMIGG